MRRPPRSLRISLKFLLYSPKPDSEARKRFENVKDYYDKLLAPLDKAIEDSERLTERDYCMRINV